MKLLVTGAAGYIGSHASLELLRAGYEVIALDNLSNGHPESIRRVERLAARSCPLKVVDLLDQPALLELFEQEAVEGVIHFAGLKAVGESVEKPLLYYRNNVSGTANLLEAMQRSGVKRLLFSSSCTVYGDTEQIPIREECPAQPANPYGRTKWMVEQMLGDLLRSDPEWHLSILRYFNPVGADPSGEIGEDPAGIPDNLMPYLSQVAVGRREELQIFGDDYPTRDGTGIRDYLHVSDLATGHIRAWEKLLGRAGLSIYNLGRGEGFSVLEMVRMFERVSGKRIPFRITGRRPGDIAEAWADPSLAEKELGWRAERDLETICRDAWNWQTKNPQGYGKREKKSGR